MAAADYRFTIPKADMVVDLQPDASAEIKYRITFSNDPSADAIDVVDIGLPHRDYDFSNMSASVNGHSVTDIRKSEYIDIGIEAHLGAYAIAAGQGGLFEFQCTMPDMVYQDTTREDHASFQITPTWFDSSLLSGTTDLSLAVGVPQGVDPDELKWHKAAFQNKAIYDGRAYAFWKWPATRLDGPHEVGLSFPKSVMERVVPMTHFKLLVRAFEDSPELRVWSGIIFCIAFAVMFFRFTGGTGCSLFGVALITIIISFVISARWHILSWFALIPIFVFVEWGLRKKKQKYLPAIAAVEGGGIKRGLTAPEAAILLEMPLNKVLTLVLFGLLKKGVVEKTRDVPLEVVVNPEYHGSAAERRKFAAERGTVLHGYESPFITALVSLPGKPVSQVPFTSALTEMVKTVAGRMQGFDVEQSKAYYRHIIGKAWSEAEALGDVQLRQEKVDNNLDWLILAPDYDDRFRTWEREGYHYQPTWGRTTYGSPSASVPRGTPGGTSLGDVASSFAGWSENFMGGVAGSIEPMKLATSKGGFLDLSGLDKVTGDVLEALASSSGSGGGGGGGGCACAGCACACACAGGGR